MSVVFIVQRFPEDFLGALTARVKPADGAEVDVSIAPQLSWAASVFLWIVMTAQRILRQSHQVRRESAAQLLMLKVLWRWGAGKLA